MGKLIDIMTVDATPFKTLIEGLKDILTDTNIEIIRSDYEEEETKTETETETKPEQKKPKDKKKDEKEDTKKKDDVKEKEKNVKEKEKDKKDKKDVKDKKKNDEKEEKVVPEKDDKKEKDKGGLKIITTDNTRSLLISVKLQAKAFNRFYCKKKTFDMAVNLTLLYKIIKNVDKDDMLNMYVNDDDKQTLIVKIVSADKKESTSKLKLLDINKTQIEIPPISCEASIKFSTSEFHKICREMNGLAEHLEIKTTRNSVVFSCKGDSIEQTKTYYTDETNSVTIKFSQNSPEVVQGIFELKYLTMFSKYSNLCTHIFLYMKNDWLLCINYTVATFGNMLMCLTPVREDVVKQNFDDDTGDYDDPEVNYKDD